MNPKIDDLLSPGDDAGAEIDRALACLELAAPPAGLAPGVMARIQRLPRPQPAALPRFRLGWLDLALSLFFPGMAALVGLLSGSLPAPLLRLVRLEALYWLARFQLEPWLLLPPLAGLALLLGLALLAVWLARPGRFFAPL